MSIIFVLIIWACAWIYALAAALDRQDLDPVTRLTWVVVLIFVPLFGIVLYAVVAPSRPKRPGDPANQLSGTPWEHDSGHTHSASRNS